MICPDSHVLAIRSVIFVPRVSLSETCEFSPDLRHNELIFKLNGENRVDFGGSLWEEKENFVRYLPSGKHSAYRVERRLPGDCIDIFFDTDQPLAPEAFCRQAPHADKMRSLFLRAENVWRKKRQGYAYAAMRYLYGILALLCTEEEYAGAVADRLAPGMEYLEKHFLEDIRLETCGELCGMSYANFKKRFAARYHTSPKAYTVSLRLRHAADLLASGLYSVGEVADMCGYKNEFYFSRAFTRYTGINPSRLRRR